MYLPAKLIEQIYDCRNQRLVMPLPFRENIVTYKKSNSPMLSTLKASSSPSDSYTYLSSWLNNAASKPIEFPQGLIRVVFDNGQVIGKRYQVKANQQHVPPSVITSIYLTIDSDNFIQYGNEFKPSNWMFDTVTSSLTSGIKNSFSEYVNIFRLTRNDLINARTNVLVKNLDRDDNEFFDIADKMVNERVFSEKYKICSSCNESAPITQRICKVCKNKLVKKKPVLIFHFTT